MPILRDYRPCVGRALPFPLHRQRLSSLLSPLSPFEVVRLLSDEGGGGWGMLAEKMTFVRLGSSHNMCGVLGNTSPTEVAVIVNRSGLDKKSAFSRYRCRLRMRAGKRLARNFPTSI